MDKLVKLAGLRQSAVYEFLAAAVGDAVQGEATRIEAWWHWMCRRPRRNRSTLELGLLGMKVLLTGVLQNTRLRPLHKDLQRVRMVILRTLGQI